MTQCRKPNETPEEFAIRRAYETGHFWGPENPNGPNVDQADLSKLKEDNPVVKAAFRSFSRMMVRDYAVAVAKHHKRAPDFDGVRGPALTETLEVARCAVPDHAPPPGVVFQFDDPQIQEVVERMQANAQVAVPAVGGGNWQRCHGVGEFHRCRIRVDRTNMPSFLQNGVFEKIMRERFIPANREIGLDKEFVTSGPANSVWSFVNSSDGWIGLAIKTLGLGCGDEVWARFLSTYRPSNTEREWGTLFLHEDGHNDGLDHTNGGIMAPSIQTGLAMWRPSDPSLSRMTSWYGGVPYVPGEPPPPNPPPVPTTLEQVVAMVNALQKQQFEDNIRNAVQDAQIAFLMNRKP